MSDGGSGGFRGNRPPMRGGSGKPRTTGPAFSWSDPRPATKSTAAAPGPRAKKRVLFICIGNSIRSQMAEAFARTYGSDVIEPHSAGLQPATLVSPIARQILQERNISMEGQFPKGLDMAQEAYDIVVNVSGQRVNFPGANILEWPVADPIGQKEQVYREASTQIEALVMRLILDLRS